MNGKPNNTIVSCIGHVLAVVKCAFMTSVGLVCFNFSTILTTKPTPCLRELRINVVIFVRSIHYMAVIALDKRSHNDYIFPFKFSFIARQLSFAEL